MLASMKEHLILILLDCRMLTSLMFYFVASTESQASFAEQVTMHKPFPSLVVCTVASSSSGFAAHPIARRPTTGFGIRCNIANQGAILLCGACRNSSYAGRPVGRTAAGSARRGAEVTRNAADVGNCLIRSAGSCRRVSVMVQSDRGSIDNSPIRGDRHPIKSMLEDALALPAG